ALVPSSLPRLFSHRMAAPLLLLSTLLVAASAQQYGYAVDISQGGSLSAFNCLRSNHYSSVFIRVYKPDGNGGVDTAGILNVGPAFNSGLGVEVYMTPNPLSSKSANTQVDELVKAMRSGGVQAKSVWVLVTSPINWKQVQATNLNFIKTVISRFSSYGINIGIYTSRYDWQQITGNAGYLGSNIRLWYWNVYGLGPDGESPANFLDFRPFGQWSIAAVKQFGQYESLCGFTVNRNIYPLSAATHEMLTSNKISSDKGEIDEPIGTGVKINNTTGF
ncbi:hypothetical protein PMAYCL1PPCAC_08674, partial [Pristionchus mayeri]